MRQSGVRFPARYREAARLAISPSHPPATARAYSGRPSPAANLAEANERRGRPAARCDDALERGAALDERAVPQVRASLSQEVEDDERDRRLLDVAAVRVGEVDPSLQLLEPGGRAVGVDRDNLAVEDDGLLEAAGPAGEGARDFGKLAGLVVAEPRPEPHVVRRRDLGDGADAVVLRLVDEPGIFERRVGKRRQHRAGRSGHAP